MDQDRRAFLHDTGRFIFLTGAATLAWDFVVAGAPEQAPNYVATNHWWGMIIDIDKCIGSGNCVRACKAENDVPLEEGCFRTWVERYQVDPHDLLAPDRGLAQRRVRRFSRDRQTRRRPESVLRAQDVQSVRRFTLHAGVPGRRDVREPGRRRARRQDALPRLPVCVQACPYGCRYIDPRTHTVDKCTLCYHRITKGLTTACAEVCPTGARQLVDLKNPKDPVHEFLREHKIPVLKPDLATGSKVYYNGLDGTVR